MSQQPTSDRPTPPIPEATLSYASPDLGLEVRSIGIAQRQLIKAFLSAIVIVFGGLILLGVFGLGDRVVQFLVLLVFYAMAAVMMVCIYRLSAALGYGLTRRILYTAAMVLPYINVFIILSASNDATRALRRQGIRVGLMGARISDLP